MTDKIKKGKAGEDLAAALLISKGYQIVARNFRYRRAEIDLIVAKEDWIVFVEVKARSSVRYGYPESFVDQNKIKNILLAADEYIHQRNWNGQVRYDVISVDLKNPKQGIEHFEDAFH